MTAPTPEQRNRVALACAYEISAWAALILRNIDRSSPDLWLKGAAVRLDALAGALMTACDSVAPLDEAEEVLQGPAHMRKEAAGA